MATENTVTVEPVAATEEIDDDPPKELTEVNDFPNHRPTNTHHVLETIRPMSSQPPVQDSAPSISVQDDTLTVEQKSKVEAELQRQIEARQRPSKWLTVVKWFFMIFVFYAVLACLTASKLTMVHLGNHLQSAKTNKSHDNFTVTSDGKVTVVKYGVESVFCMLMIILMVPYLLTFIRSMWCGAFRSDRLWPSWRSFLWGLFASVCEAVGISLFAVEVLPESDGYISVALMNGVFVIQNIWQIGSYAKARCSPGRNSSPGADNIEPTGEPTTCCNSKLIALLCFIVALGLQIVGFAIVIVFEISTKATEDYPQDKLWEIPLTIILLSIAWCPALQKIQLYPKITKLESLLRKRRTILRFKQRHDFTNEDSISADELEEFILEYPQCSARWKNSILQSLIKMVLVPGCCIMWGHVMGAIKVEALGVGFTHVNLHHPVFTSFMVHIFLSYGGNILALLACTMCLQRSGFSLPLCLATPLSLVLIVWIRTCNLFVGPHKYDCPDMDDEKQSLIYMLPVAACLYLAQLLSTGYFICMTQTIAMQKESHLFWLPGYNSFFLEQHLLLNRKNVETDTTKIDPLDRARRIRVFVCTTMYREADYEMEQLLRSLKRVNDAKQDSHRNFESHIFFDNGVKGKRLTEFALQLVSVARKTLGLRPALCTKIQTPYGMRLNWRLPTSDNDNDGMIFCIHLKDNTLVKNKKRWSQIMYMSYVLDFYIKSNDEANDQDTFILTTDADVKFSPQSVEALLDLMARDSTTGAVCSRTFPMGSGPVYWYQIFDYAIGHWLQKASNHVLGSVLCCPGCFSVYRVEALRDVLPIYASSVDKASEFLTKDMGEDRWLCTLMVQSGWRLEYCAAADNSTYCPEDFDEYFKQRRRWIPSTMANQVLMLQEWLKISVFNKQISVFFMFYQGILLFSTMISPSVCILIIVGGLYYAWGVNQIASSILLIIITVGYVACCLYTSQDTQLMVAKVLTVLFAIIMCAVTVGTSVQIARENDNTTSTSPTKGPEPTIQLPRSISTLYLGGLVGIFFITGILHLPEFTCLVHGIWYLLCLPTGNLVLVIYSVCNITDRSWGTREEKKAVTIESSKAVVDIIVDFFKKICFCFNKDNRKPEEDHLLEVETDSTGDMPSTVSSDSLAQEQTSGVPALKTMDKTRKRVSRTISFGFHDKHVDKKPINTADWLPRNLKAQYSDLFYEHGYDDTSFISGISESELKEIGVDQKGHRKAILEATRSIPQVQIDPNVPENASKWLDEIGLPEYKESFIRNNIITSSNMEVLKEMSVEDIQKDLGIVKRGHLRRLTLAIQQLRHKTEGEKIMIRVRYEIDAVTTHDLMIVDKREHDFWEKLRKSKLLPDSKAFAYDTDLKAKLTELRDSTLMVFALSNVIWIILITTLASKSELNVLGTNPLGLCFLVIFGFILVIQFLCMIFHRGSTLMHNIARAPLMLGRPSNASWAFDDDNIMASTYKRSMLSSHIDSEDNEARLERDNMNINAQRRYEQSVLRRERGPESLGYICEGTDDPSQSLLEKSRRRTGRGGANYEAI